MKSQFLYCLGCKNIINDKEIICPHCRNIYSQVVVRYNYPKKIKNIGDMYKHFLPFQLFSEGDFKNCTLSEYSGSIWLKDEGENDSKSIKEKDIFVGLKVAEYLGIDQTICISGGSGIGVVDYFSSKYKASLKLYSPTSVSKHIHNQVLIGKDYEETFRLAIKNKLEWNITPGINPYSQEGCKVIAWQLINSQVYFDAVVIPCGNGSSLWGIYKGYKEAKEQGLIKNIPKLYGVELKNGPISKSLKTDKIEKNQDILGSKATSIDVKESFSLQKALIAIKRSGGGAINVNEIEITDSYNKLNVNQNNSSFTASTSLAAALILLKKLKNKKILCILTAKN